MPREDVARGLRSAVFLRDEALCGREPLANLSFGNCPRSLAGRIPPPRREWARLDRKWAFRPFQKNGLCVMTVEPSRRGSQVQLKHSEWKAALREMTPRCFDRATGTMGFVLPSNFVALPDPEDRDAEKAILRLAKEHPKEFSAAIDLDGNSLLHMAVQCGNGCKRIVPALLRAGFDVGRPNLDGETPLHAAARADCPTCYLKMCEVDAALAAENTVDLENHDRMTPLDVILAAGSAKLLRALLNEADGRFGKDLAGMRFGDSGETLLHLAATCHQVRLVDLLLRDFPVDQQDRDGATPLMVVFVALEKPAGLVSNQKMVADTVGALIKAGTDLKVRDKWNNTVLHRAALSRLKGSLVTRDVVRLLIEAGADPGVVNDYGETAADLARMNGREKMALFLESKVKTRLEVLREMQLQNRA